MGLVIHDLTPEAWEPMSREYPGWTVVSDAETIRPCTGCFGCWNRTPGKCVIRDGYENMGELIHKADRVTVISRYTFGGFSGFVKNVFDRCLGYVLPQFEVVGGETHHKKRYEENKPFTFVFYGAALSEEENELTVFVINADWEEDHEFTLDLGGFGNLQFDCISGSDIAAVNLKLQQT